jgi:hypothetical protein
MRHQVINKLPYWFLIWWRFEVMSLHVGGNRGAPILTLKLPGGGKTDEKHIQL